MMRWIGISAVCLSLSSFGFYLSVICRKRISILRLLSELFSEFSSLAASGSEETADIIAELIKRPPFLRLTFLQDIADGLFYGCNIKELWYSAVMNIKDISFPHGRARELLLSFSDVFGKSSLYEFSEKCKSYSSQFNALSEKEEEKWQKNRSLISLSGIIAATFVFLVLI